MSKICRITLALFSACLLAHILWLESFAQGEATREAATQVGVTLKAAGAAHGAASAAHEATADAHQTSGRAELTPARVVELLAGSGVFVFFDPSCPICAEYFPTIEKLSAKYGKSEPFHLVFSEEDAPAVKGFIEDYQPHCLVLIDSASRLQAALQARVTPQAFVLRDGKIVYSGRIDDRYESIGRRRSIVRSYDLDLALSAVAKGEMPLTKSTQAVGCFIEIEKSKNEEGQ